MQEIEKMRSELDQIHKELFALLRRRFVITEKIWKIKIAQSLPFTDLKREENVIHQFDAEISAAEEKQAVHNILKSIVSETKKYLEVKLK